MREIMISIQPQWIEKILNGEKTIEIRKTMPKYELPCKVYIYCTKGKYEIFNTLHGIEHKGIHTGYLLNGKVVAEFTLNKVDFWQPYWIPEVLHICTMSKLSCVDVNDLQDYSKGERIYAWHIDNLKIYDKPKELSEFKHWVVDCQGWCNKKNKAENVYVLEDIKRPPQSWCYVERSEL